MSQDIREYDLTRLDRNEDEARRLAVTATVGPTPEETDNSRGVQLTLETQRGYAYGRVSEDQIEDLIEVLEARIDSDKEPEATGWGSNNKRIKPNGEAKDVAGELQR